MVKFQEIHARHLVVLSTIILLTIVSLFSYRLWRNNQFIFVGTEHGSSVGFYRTNLFGIGVPKLILSGNVNSPRWSPDGKKIVFVSSEGENGSPPFHIAIIDADGTNYKKLTEGDIRAYSPTWSPDGKKIAYVAAYKYEGGCPNAIFIMNSDGSEKTQITPYAYYMDLSWTPDGEKIAYFTFEPNGIFLVTIDGSHNQQITDQWTDSRPVWSHDGDYIVFQSTRDDTNDHFDIYIMRPDGTNIQRLTTDPAHDRNPSWSPNGKKIIFESNRDSENDAVYHIYIMNIDGSEQRRVTEIRGISPDWRP